MNKKILFSLLSLLISTSGYTATIFPSPGNIKNSNDTFTQPVTFQSSTTVISANGNMTASVVAPNGGATMLLNSGANSILETVGASSSILYVGEISSHRGMFDGAANPLLIDAANGNAVIGATSNANSQLSIVGQTTDAYTLRVGTATQSNIFNLAVSTSGIVSLAGSGAPPNSQALCLLGGQLGHCTSVVGAGGGCTCATP